MLTRRLPQAWLTLLPAVTPLRPHVIAVATPEPFLIAAGIVLGEDVNRPARAAGTRRLGLLGIGWAMLVYHAADSALDAPCISLPVEFTFRSNFARSMPMTRIRPRNAAESAGSNSSVSCCEPDR